MGDKSQLPDQLPLITRFKLHLVGLLRNLRLSRLVDVSTPAPATKLIGGATPVSTSDIPIDPSRNLWFRLFAPTNINSDESLPLILYFHGGGFCSYGPDTKTFDDLCCHLAAKVPAVIASVNYRLAPAHKYPAQYDDAFDALKFIDAQNDAVLPANTDLSRCFVAGDSAGGNIAHHLTIRALENCDRFAKVRIAGVVMVQPFFGGEERTESEIRLSNAAVIDVTVTDVMWRNFLPEGENRNHPAVNVFGGGEKSNEEKVKSVDFPKGLVIVGGYDPLQDWQRRYVQGLKKCGKQVEMIEYPNAFHGFYAFPELPEFALLVDDVKNFVLKQGNLG